MLQSHGYIYCEALSQDWLSAWMILYETGSTTLALNIVMWKFGADFQGCVLSPTYLVAAVVTGKDQLMCTQQYSKHVDLMQNCP